MRKAKREDNWRALSRGTTQKRLTSITQQGISGMPTTEIAIPGRICAITGLNGVGKSTLIQIMHLLLSRGNTIHSSSPLLRTSTGRIDGQVAGGDGTTAVSAVIDSGTLQQTPERIPIQAAWIDTSSEITPLMRSYRSESNFNELLAQYTFVSLDDKPRMALSDIVGKDYENCEVLEIDDFRGMGLCPYFRVESQGLAYGTEAMGLGEASIHYIIWHLMRLPKSSIVFIEEPEAFISARSQIRLMDEIASICLRQEISAVLTTHSPYIIRNFDPKDVIILSKDGAETCINFGLDVDLSEALFELPRLIRRDGVLLVEDEASLGITRAWLTRYWQSEFPKWRIVIAGSAGEVTSALKGIPPLGVGFTIIGLLDGDERSRNSADALPISYLPSTNPPEFIIQEALVRSLHPIASQLGLDLPKLRLVLNTLQGRDHHDWLLDLRRFLTSQSIDYDLFIATAFDAWANDAENDAACITSIGELERVTKSRLQEAQKSGRIG